MKVEKRCDGPATAVGAGEVDAVLERAGRARASRRGARRAGRGRAVGHGREGELAGVVGVLRRWRERVGRKRHAVRVLHGGGGRSRESGRRKVMWGRRLAGDKARAEEKGRARARVGGKGAGEKRARERSDEPVLSGRGRRGSARARRGRLFRPFSRGLLPGAGCLSEGAARPVSGDGKPGHLVSGQRSAADGVGLVRLMRRAVKGSGRREPPGH
jgi:hypothetical protein